MLEPDRQSKMDIFSAELLLIISPPLEMEKMNRLRNGPSYTKMFAYQERREPRRRLVRPVRYTKCKHQR